MIDFFVDYGAGERYTMTTTVWLAVALELLFTGIEHIVNLAKGLPTMRYIIASITILALVFMVFYTVYGGEKDVYKGNANPRVMAIHMLRPRTEAESGWGLSYSFCEMKGASHYEAFLCL